MKSTVSDFAFFFHNRIRKRLLLAECSRSHTRIFGVAIVRFTPKAAAQMLESGLN
jgi:hypothetical protein